MSGYYKVDFRGDFELSYESGTTWMIFGFDLASEPNTLELGEYPLECNNTSREQISTARERIRSHLEKIGYQVC